MPDSQHLSADELDILVLGMAAPRASSHVETCESCRTMVRLDRIVVTTLGQLPALDPSPLFADRVMREVRVAVPQAAPVVAAGHSPRAVAARRRLAAGALLGGGVLGAGFAWAAANPGTALGWVTPGLRSAGESLWLSFQTLSANASEQPWFSSISEALATPSRVVLTACVAGAVYAVGLVGFRQLLTEPATDAAV